MYKVEKTESAMIIWRPDGTMLCDTSHHRGYGEADAHDIAGKLNACADIPRPGGIEYAIDFLRITARSSSDGVTRDGASKALREMGIEP